MSRDNALNQLQSSPLTNEEIKNEKNFVANKLNITEHQLDDILMVPTKVLKIINHIIVLLTFLLRLFNFLELKKRVIQ